MGVEIDENEIIARMGNVAADWTLKFRWDLHCHFDWSKRLLCEPLVVWC